MKKSKKNCLKTFPSLLSWVLFGVSSMMIIMCSKQNVLVSKIVLNESSVNCTVGYAAELKATVYPEDAANKNITWASSDASVAQVNNKGMVTATGKGTATITAKAEDGSNVSSSCTFVVADKEIIKVSSISLSSKKLLINSTKLNYTLKATFILQTLQMRQ